MDLTSVIVAGVFLHIAIFGPLGMWVASQCGRDTNEGALLGIFLGPIGLIIEGLLPKFPNDKSTHHRDSR